MNDLDHWDGGSGIKRLKGENFLEYRVPKRRTLEDYGFVMRDLRTDKGPEESLKKEPPSFMETTETYKER